jgi:hypothetical protein
MLFHSFAFSAFRSSFALVAAAIVPHHGEKAYTNRQYFMEPIRVSEMAQEILLLFRFAFFFPNKRIVNYSGFFFVLASSSTAVVAAAQFLLGQRFAFRASERKLKAKTSLSVFLHSPMLWRSAFEQIFHTLKLLLHIMVSVDVFIILHLEKRDFN